jgi:hypothetical protein
MFQRALPRDCAAGGISQEKLHCCRRHLRFSEKRKIEGQSICIRYFERGSVSVVACWESMLSAFVRYCMRLSNFPFQGHFSQKKQGGAAHLQKSDRAQLSVTGSILSSAGRRLELGCKVSANRAPTDRRPCRSNLKPLSGGVH